MVSKHNLDATDLAILRVLQANARATYTEIGKAVGLSAPSAHDRVHRLEDRGVIRGYHAAVDPELLGLGVLALVGVVPTGVADLASMEAAFAADGQIEAVYSVAGEESHLLVVRARTLPELSGVLQQIREVEGIAHTRTAVVLATPVLRGPAL